MELHSRVKSLGTKTVYLYRSSRCLCETTKYTPPNVALFRVLKYLVFVSILSSLLTLLFTRCA